MLLLKRLEEIEKKYNELSSSLSNSSAVNDKNAYQKAMKEVSAYGVLVEKYNEYKKIINDISDSEELLRGKDPEIAELARSELKDLESRKSIIEKEINVLLLPKDPTDDKNNIMEIRAGTGGEEAALFASDLFRMYSRYAEIHNWKVDILNSNPTGRGGFKEIIFSIEGKGAFSRLKYESGVHRVQRVPTTEASGRIHTSTITVAVLPEAEEVDVDIKPDDLKIDVFCSSGAGGQSVNTTYSAVRMTHIPTGIVVSCQDERSQQKNKAKAMKVLMAKLLNIKIQEQQSQILQERNAQIGGAERSEKIRTYNYPQNRITDHRIGLSLHNLPNVLNGNIDEIINPLIAFYQEEQLKDMEKTRK